MDMNCNMCRVFQDECCNVHLLCWPALSLEPDSPSLHPDQVYWAKENHPDRVASPASGAYLVWLGYSDMGGVGSGSVRVNIQHNICCHQCVLVSRHRQGQTGNFLLFVWEICNNRIFRELCKELWWESEVSAMALDLQLLGWCFTCLGSILWIQWTRPGHTRILL